jgi:hypothetical protein
MNGRLDKRCMQKKHMVCILSILVCVHIGVWAACAYGTHTDDIDQGSSLIDTVSVYISNKAAPAGAVFTIQVYVTEDVSAYHILAMRFKMVFNSNLLSFRTAVAGSVLPEGRMFEFGITGDTVLVAAGAADPFEGEGTLARIEFRVLSDVEDGQTDMLNFALFQFNEPHVGPAAIAHSGLFIVGRFPDIELESSEYDFGQVNVGSTDDWNLGISNVGWANLLIESIASTSQDFNVTGLSFPVTIEPGADRNITVTFAPGNVGSRTGNLMITSNDYFENEVYVSLTGFGVAPDISLSSHEHSFGQVTVGYTSSWEFEVYNVGNAELMIDSVLAYPSVFRAPSPVFPFAVAEGGTLRVAAQFYPDQVGQAAGVLTLFSNDPDEHAVDVFLSGVGIPPEADILITTATYDFGGVYLGTVATWSMPVSNVGTAPLTVNSITSDQEAYQITSPTFPRTIQPGASINAVVAFQPVLEESVSGTLLVDNDDPDESTILIPVTGYGVAPSIMTVQGGFGNQGDVAAQVPIAMENQVDVVSVEFVLGFPDGILTPMAAIPTERSNAMETFQVDLSYDVGKSKLTIVGLTQSIPAGIGSIAKLAFRVAADAPNGEYPLTLSEVTATDIHGSEVSFVLQDSFFIIGPVGLEESVGNIDLPRRYALSQNYPNPFNPETEIGYQIPDRKAPAHITLRVFNVLGQEVRALVNEVKKPGYYMVSWNGTDALGQEVPSGVYLYRLETVEFVDTKKMILAR